MDCSKNDIKQMWCKLKDLVHQAFNGNPPETKTAYNKDFGWNDYEVAEGSKVVKKSDKATQDDVNNAEANKWVDSALLNLVVGLFYKKQEVDNKLNDKLNLNAKATYENIQNHTPNTWLSAETAKYLNDTIKLSNGEDIKVTQPALNTQEQGETYVTRAYFGTKEFKDSDNTLVVDNSTWHTVSIPYKRKFKHSKLKVTFHIKWRIQGELDTTNNTETVAYWVNCQSGINSSHNNLPNLSHFIKTKGQTDGATIRLPESLSGGMVYPEFSPIENQQIPIDFRFNIEYIEGLKTDSRVIRVYGDSHIIVEETEIFLAQSKPIYLSVLDVLRRNNQVKDKTIITWNVHYGNEDTGAGIKAKLQEHIEAGTDAIVGLCEVAVPNMDKTIFGEKGKDGWWYISTPTYSEYYQGALESDGWSGHMYHELHRVLASTKPFEDIKMYVMPTGYGESHWNFKNAIAGKVDGVWYVLAHLGSSSEVNYNQITELGNWILDPNGLGNPDKVVVMGDMNIYPQTQARVDFRNNTGLVDALPDKSSFCANDYNDSNKTIDMIAYKGVNVTNGAVIEDTCGLSDHRLCKAKLEI